MSVTQTTWTTFLLTGLRGNGKTLKAVSMMDEFIAAGVPVYACNFRDLTLPGVQHLDDPHGWRDLPPGSVLFVDEAQRFWRARRSGEVPESLQQMETQRHDAIRLVVLTQQPTYLDKHLRGLVDVHTHLVRRAGLEASQTYTWERCCDEPNEGNAKDIAEAGIFGFPTKYYGQYKSADEHTIKRRIPLRAKLIFAALPIILGIFWYVANMLGGADPEAGDSPPEDGPKAVASAAGDAPAKGRRRREPLTKEEFVLQMVPRLPGAQWSAPVFDEANSVETAPEVYCIASGTESCRCITEQGTKYVFDADRPTKHLAMCLAYIENGGVYNPFKRQVEGDRGTAPAVVGADAPTDNASPPGEVIKAEQVTGYGDFRPQGQQAAPG